MEEQVADVLTNPLSRVKFEYFLSKLGVIQKNLLERGSDDEIIIDDDMELICQCIEGYLILSVCLQMLMRSHIHLWTSVSYHSHAEDGPMDNNTLMLKVFLALIS